ncbi:Lipopolysaccharide heptosyltransferase I [hydrothermal vent metagenome]|uniref:Lipopolysaccharide heptosyltransferase 1 n=1 Tax=hydrothermal vent metagenome TaxID=652676 RepID=A0A3B1E771_9ZZZZ
MKICIVKLSAMGDIIHSMVALQFIKYELPDVKIDWIVESSFKGILENNRDINKILPIDLKLIKQNKSEFFAQIKLLRDYSKNNYDLIIDAQGLLKSAIVSKLLKNKTSGSIVVGFDKKSIREGIATWFYDKKISIAYDKNTIDRNVKVLTSLFRSEITSKDILSKKPFLFFCENKSIKLHNEYNLFVIGSTWDSRNYPKEKFVKIADALKTKTYIVWGSDEEYNKAVWMEKQSKFLEILPKGNLNDLKYIISKSKLLIGNDTGPTHMAWGLGIPSITIFGPTPINRVYITDINKVIKSQSKINHLKLNKLDFSINEIKPEDIIAIAREIAQKT